MTSAKDLKDLLRSARDVLIKQAAERDAAVSETARLETENGVLHDVLGLVGTGLIDPDDVTTKLAEFLLNPAQLTIIKQASDAGFVVSAHLGKLAGTDPTQGSGSSSTPESRLASRLQSIVNE